MTGSGTVDPLALFHPIVSRWWHERFARADGGVMPPTPAQVRGWEAIRSGASTLIAAPTGSGKTLAAFLHAIDALLREGIGGPLPDEVRVLYVSPLKALSADIHKNLAEPRREIRQLASAVGLPPVRITAAVRTGDTPQSERAGMLRTPPHILVTTPESLYLLLTAERSRAMLRTVRTVIVDEIHAVLESRRGAHLALSLERLEHVAGRPLQRIGLSATQKPIEEVASFLTGSSGDDAQARGCTIVDEGHVRELDLGLELPGSPLEAVMAAEVWQEIFERIVQLIEAHRTTLVFVNTRRLAERVARALSERLGEAAVTAHHGSLARDVRLDAEERLKTGQLRALVATASLELGIDIGHVDLVIQLGSPRRIAAFLQRVGRSGHTVAGTPKGRLFPLSRDDLVECAALLRAVRRRELDRVIIPERPLDVLAQQVVAESAAEDWDVDRLHRTLRRAWPYRDLERATFDDIVNMVARGFATRRGRRGALVHHDGINGRVRGRKGARLVAITSGGAIPEIADYRVELEPEGTFVGTLNEDFAIESSAGDVFQLGNTSWRILGIGAGVVRVADAQGEPPTIPFWLGEAPARSDELSAHVSALRADVEHFLEEHGQPSGTAVSTDPDGDAADARVATLAEQLGVSPLAAAQLLIYLGESRRLLGVIPTQDTLVLERFFDEAGGMQLVLHAPFGARVNRAWGLALRKKFCRTFNFELQAAATDDGLVLSLGPQHSFPLDDVFRYLHPNTVRDTLVQAMFDSPLFQTRWRWNATLSLAVQRNRNGRKVPPPLQRMQAEDLMAAVFPDAAACFENIAGDREVPDHPLVNQVVIDCLTEAMDLPQLERVLRRIFAGTIRCIARDVPEPSPLTHELLSARPYAFLDDAPLEERRTQAVYTRRALEPSSANDLGALDAEAIERVRAEAWPEADNADELHDALLTSGFLTAAELARQPDWAEFLAELVALRRVVRTSSVEAVLWVAAERAPEISAVVGALLQPPHHAGNGGGPGAPVGDGVAREDALRELVRSRLEILGPVTAAELAAPLGVDEGDIEAALIAVEAEGAVLRGSFTPGRDEREWCDRRLLARIHRYTLNRLRAEIQPVTPAEFMKFLFRWQRADEATHAAGPDGLLAVIEQLDGFEIPAAAWESDVLPLRCSDYEPELLDRLCLSGRIGWGRVSTRANGIAAARPLRSSPISLFVRTAGGTRLEPAGDAAAGLSSLAAEVRATLERRGASFFAEIVTASGLLATQVEQALAELVAAGLVTADSYAGLRALLTPAGERAPVTAGARRRRRTSIWTVDTAGRWSLLRTATGASGAGHADSGAATDGADETPAQRRERAEASARTLLRRWGVIFRRLLEREPEPGPWREIAMACRRMEARGEIRGGRFVSGFAGEQFALPEAVGTLRAVRREGANGHLLAVSAADPLNLTGLITPEARVTAVSPNRVLYRDGAPIAALEAGDFRWIARIDEADRRELERALIRRPAPPRLRQYLRTRGPAGARVGDPGRAR